MFLVQFVEKEETNQKWMKMKLEKNYVMSVMDTVAGFVITQD